jgi:pimeloyl-ACP methyl ester carboxylesterase
MAELHEHRLDPELGHIQAPTLIVAGEQDQHCPPRAAEIIAERIAGSRLEVLPDTGHPIPVERPADVARLIAEARRANVS